MRRFYYISDDLDNLEQIEHELESGGIARPQIYLLSNDDVGLENHDVNRVASFLKTDVVHLGEIGAVLGLAIAALILLVAHYSGIAAEVSWVPFIFLAIIGFGFATWEAGFIGLHAPNVHFARFEKALEKGRHVLFVETDPADEKSLKTIGPQTITQLNGGEGCRGSMKKSSSDTEERLVSNTSPAPSTPRGAPTTIRTRAPVACPITPTKTGFE